ncbi:MAG: hypothetical protein HC945_02790 [Nitrosarchaeum sp.]|nr:hypothetical protein [Nitrosarchaeum sp.]
MLESRSRIDAYPAPSCERSINYTAPRTVVDILEIQDIIPGQTVTFPFTIQNNEDADKAYVMSISGLEAWARTSISPGSLLLVPRAGTMQGELYFTISPEAMPGPRSFVVTVASDTDVTQRLLTLRIQTPPVNAWLAGTFNLALSVLSLLLIVYALFLAFTRVARSRTQRPVAKNSH